jgi:hypothetical protein
MSARRVALFLLYGLAEASVLAPALVTLPTPLQGLSESAALGAAWLVLCAIAATGRGIRAAAGAVRRRASLLVRRAVMGLWLVVLLLASVARVAARQGIDPTDALLWLVQLAGALLIWWRATSLADAELDPREAQRQLRNGLTVFALYAIVNLLNPAFNLMVFLLPFLVSSVLILPLSYLERVEQSESGRHVPMTRRWWRAVLLSAGAAMLICLAVLLVLSPDLLSRAVMLVIGLVMLPFLLVGGFIVQALIQWLGPLLGRPQEAPQQFNVLEELRQQLLRQQTEAAPLVIDNRVMLLLVLVVVAVVLVAAVVTTVRVRRESGRALARDKDEEAQDAPGGPTVPGLGDSLRRTLDLRRWLAGVSVRRIYARMAHMAGRRGHARQPAQTPYDYLPELRLAFPNAAEDVRVITEAYVATHYGEVPETDQELNAIRAAWERVRAR